MTSNPNNNFDNTNSSTAAGGAIPTNRFEQAGAGGAASGYPTHNITIQMPHPGAMPQTQAGAGAPQSGMQQGGQNFGTTGYSGQPGQAGMNQPGMNQPGQAGFGTSAGQTGFNAGSQPPFDQNMGGAGQQQYPQSFAPQGQQFGSTQMGGASGGTGPRGIDFQDAPERGVGTGATGAAGGMGAGIGTGTGNNGSNWNTGNTLQKHHHAPGEKRGDVGSNPLNMHPAPEGGFAVGGAEGLPMGRASAADKLIGKFEQEAGKLTGDYNMQVTGELRAAGGKAAVKGEARAPHPKDL